MTMFFTGTSPKWMVTVVPPSTMAVVKGTKTTLKLTKSVQTSALEPVGVVLQPNMNFNKIFSRLS